MIINYNLIIALVVLSSMINVDPGRLERYLNSIQFLRKFNLNAKTPD